MRLWQSTDRRRELFFQIAVAFEAESFAAVEGVLAGPIAENHFGMVQKVFVDGNRRAIDRKRGDSQPFWIDMVGSLAPVTLAKKDDVGHDGGPLAFERIRRKPHGPEEVGPFGEVFADGGVLLVERVMRCHQSQHAAGLESVDGFGEEVIVQRVLLSAVFELDVGERNIAYDGVDAILREFRVAVVLDADVVFGMKGPGDATGDRIHLDADKPSSGPGWIHEIADAATRFQDRGVRRESEPFDGVLNARDHRRRSVKGVERGSLGALVFLGAQQRFEFPAQDAPAFVLEPAAHRIGEEGKSHGTEARESGEDLFFFGGGRSLFALDGLQCFDGCEDVACLCRFTGGHCLAGFRGRSSGVGSCLLEVRIGCWLLERFRSRRCL